jgi:hypothetical protein
LKEILKHQEVEKDALSAYAVFDPGRKGHFSIRQLRDAFVMNCKATPLEMAEIFRMADPDLDGKVNEKGEYFSKYGTNKNHHSEMLRQLRVIHIGVRGGGAGGAAAPPIF